MGVGRRVVLGLFFVFLPWDVRSALLVNEVAFDESAGAFDWVEIVNTGPAPIAIDGVELDDEDTAAGNHITLHLSTPVPPGAFVLVYVDALGADETDFSDSLAVLYTGTATTVALAATEDELSLYQSGGQSTATLVDFLSWVTDGAYNGAADQATAVAAGQWPSGVAVALSDKGSGYSIGRRPGTPDTNALSDWRAFAVPTPGRSNVDLSPLAAEACDNTLDDDGDSLIDCADPDCAGAFSCPGSAAPRLSVDPVRNPFSPYDPDPFFQSAAISFNVADADIVKTIRVVNVQGETVRALINNDAGPGGVHYAGQSAGAALWDGRDDGGEVVPVGIYVVFLEGTSPANGARVTAKTTVVVGRPF